MRNPSACKHSSNLKLPATRIEKLIVQKIFTYPLSEHDLRDQACFARQQTEVEAAMALKSGRLSMTANYFALTPGNINDMQESHCGETTHLSQSIAFGE